MSKSTKQAPSTSASKKNLGGKSRTENTKENKTMNQFKQATFGVIYLILKVSFILAGVALWKMPQVHVIVDIPLYQAVGSVLVAFLVYLELYAYFTRPVDSKKAAKQKTVTKPSALDAFKLRFEETPSK